MKAIYKDNADTIVGNMDSQIFLGGSEPTTLKDLSEMLGKETIDAFNTSDTRGNSPSYGTTFQKMGHELLSRDELAVLDGGKCILQLRGVRPFLSDKYDLTQHPNYKLTSDYDPKNTFDIEKYLNRKEKIHPGDEFIVWMLIRSRLPDPVGGFIFIPARKMHQKISLAAVMQRKTTRFRVCTNDRKRFIIKEKRLWNSSTLLSKFFRLWSWLWVPVSAFGVPSTCWKVMVTITPAARVRA